MVTFGYKRPLPGHHKPARMALAAEAIAGLPAAVDLRSVCPPVYDQGSLGSCTAHALVGAVQYLQGRQQREGVPLFDPAMPSRLGLYWDERTIEGSQADDAGAVLSDGVRVLADRGWRLESDRPYDVTRFADTPGGDYRITRLTAWTPLAHDLDALRYKLAQGFPLVFGAAVYEQIQGAAGGVIALPGPGAVEIGGHAMLLCGYDDAGQVFRVRNSWGTSWGDQGYGTIPYAYVCDARVTDEIYSLEAVRPMEAP